MSRHPFFRLNLLVLPIAFLVSCRPVEKQTVVPLVFIPLVEPVERPVDTLLTAETKALWISLKHISGKGILFGQQDATIVGIDWKFADNKSDVKSLTGTHPALHGYELAGIGHEANIDSVPFSLIRNSIIRVFDRGGVNTVTWHMNNPVTGGNAWDITPGVSQLLPDSSLEEPYKNLLKELAAFFNSLKNMHGTLVPVIFRPFHESNGNWFWWGKGRCTPDEYISLWQYTVSYLRDSLHVHNLLYAYSTDMFDSKQQYLERYPGDEWVDILGSENYWDFQSGTSISNGISQLQMLVEMAGERKKIAALTECGFNGIPVKNWWTQFLFKPIREDSLARNIAYMMVWRNAHLKQYYTPFTGQKSAEDFIVFEQDTFSLFERDLPDLYNKSVP
jgi:mannan endo-1,4-beta-mannosidase